MLNIAAACYLTKLRNWFINFQFPFLTNITLFTSYSLVFRKNHSTEHALNTAIRQIAGQLNNVYQVFGIFIDFSKAFDTVKHNILLDKLKHYGIRGQCHTILKSYLSNPKQFVVYLDLMSDSFPVINGIPEGSVLGQLLFSDLY